MPYFTILSTNRHQAQAQTAIGAIAALTVFFAEPKFFSHQICITTDLNTAYQIFQVGCCFILSHYAHNLLSDHFPFPSGFVLSVLQGSSSDLFLLAWYLFILLHTDIFHLIIWSSSFLVVIVSDKLLSMYLPQLMLRHCLNS